MASEASAGVGAPAASVTRSRIAVTVLFFLFGINIGMWAAHIPIVQARLAIDPAILGFALLMSAGGTIVAQPAIGVLMARLGSRLPTAIVSPLAVALLPLVIASASVPLLFAACFALGALWGGMNVAMNTQASEIEAMRGRPTMSTFHAAASLGMLGGSVVGGFVIGSGWGDGLGALGVAAAGIALALLTIPYLVRSAPRAAGPAFVMPNAAVFGLGLLAFLAFVVEGGLVDWSALFLTVEKHADPAWAAAGFSLFTAAMFLVRLIGNGIVVRFGRKRTVVAGALLVAAGILVAVLAPFTWLSVIGFGIVGIGAANIMPILMSTAAQTEGMPPSVAISSVATMLTLGFLVGPPLIGIISSATNLSLGVSLMALFGLIIALAATLRRWPD